LKFDRVLRVALACGLGIDAFVGGLALFAQPLIEPWLDIPVKDPALTTIYGGALLVIIGVYALALRDPVRWRPLLWLCALDQTLGVLLPLIEIARGHVVGSPKIYAPMPPQLALVALYVAGAVRRPPG
jgi:hypothetical protein